MITLKIAGMTCEHCTAAVTKALAQVPGVTAVAEVNLARGDARIDGTAAAPALIAALREAGYEAQVT